MGRDGPVVSRVEHLTGATEPKRPAVCQGCTWWQERAGGRAIDKARWIEETEGRFGAWGKVYVEDGRHVGSLQYGPADAFPRARDLPAGPPSGDAVLVTCAFLSDPTSPWALQSLFLACIGESKDRGAAAVETFAVRYAPNEPFATRFLEHRTVFPRDFLADFGFRTLRSAGAVELMRLELGGIIPVGVKESRTAAVWRWVRERTTHPEPVAP